MSAPDTRTQMVRLTPDLHQSVADTAERDGCSMAEVVRRAVEAYFAPGAEPTSGAAE